MKISSCLVVLMSLLPLGASGAAAGDDTVSLLVNKGPGVDDVTMNWTPGHGGPYTVYISNVPPPEALPGNAVAITGGLSWTEPTPIAPGVVLFIRILGAGCISDGECPSGFCSDGFCCNSACAGTCEACDLAGSEGTCTPIPAGQDPEDECIPGQACDGGGACAPCPGEVCNGLDDDCDGVVDNGNPGGGAACATGQLGVCAAGTTECAGGSIICQQNVLPSAEVCDGMDNNCNGAIDEGDPQGGAACNTGLPGVCAVGTTHCVGGSISCQQNVLPSAEVCDGADNNCNGATDEGDPQGGGTCNTGLPGVCAAGTVHCLGGALSCVQNVAPSADLPDEGFVDSNCDGIDGDLAKAIFVSTAGSDANPGTSPGFPVRKISQGVALASAAGRNQVLVMAGVYATESQIVLKDGVGIYGNYTNGAFTTRTPTLTATLFAAANPTAMTGVNVVSQTDIQFLFVQSAHAIAVGQSSYGIIATNSPGLRVRFSRIQAGNGGAGSPGGGTANAPGGGNGGLGAPGCENSTVFCETCSRPPGGPGGSSSCGTTGGQGGAAAFNGAAGAGGTSGGAGGPSTPGGQGNWNTPPNYWGQNGGAGTPGVNGPGGVASYALGAYSPQGGAVGSAGGNGRGGGGGGGGGGGTVDCDSYGGGGAGGGAGGCGSSGADGGTSAGGSFAIYLWASNALIESCELLTGTGGAGGNGGTSGLAGPGGLGGRSGANPGAGNNYGGAAEQDDGSNGGRGGDGGAGGRGGHGGGGAGGPSICVVRGGGSGPVLAGNVFGNGPGGPGGPSSGIPGPAGVSAAVITP